VNQFLCTSCQNRDVRYVLVGHHYSPEMTCDYSMTMYPRAKACNKFIDPEQEVETEGEE
jgi:hypothetical protein